MIQSTLTLRNLNLIEIWIFRVAFLIVISSLLSQFCNTHTGRFSIYNITPQVNELALDTAPYFSKEEELCAAKALQQPYRYGDSGGQVFAFFSEDGEFVLKFIKERRFDHALWASLLCRIPFLASGAIKHNWKKDDRFYTDMHSYFVACTELKKEAALIYTHLDPKQRLPEGLLPDFCLHLIDKLNISHHIPLQSVRFILQKKARPPDALYQDGKIARQDVVLALQKLFLVEKEKNIFERDPYIDRNYGFINFTPIKIDIGRLRKSALKRSSPFEVLENWSLMKQQPKEEKPID